MKKRRIAKLNRLEKAIIKHAEEIERCPYCEYKVRKDILNILGYEEIKEKNA